MMRWPMVLIAAILAAPAPALEVFATTPEWGALARELGGEDVEVFVATHALQNVHRIQPRPSLIARYRQADLVIATGAELESGWLPALAQKGNNPEVRSGQPGLFEAYRYVQMLEVPERVDRAMGDVHPFGNPHLHTGAPNLVPIAQALAERLAQLDPANAAAYRARHAAFAQRWQAALARWAQLCAPLRGVPVVTSHRDSAYLFDWLGLREVATLEPRPGIPPSAGHLQSVLAQLQRTPARMVLRAAYQDPKPGEWISARAGIPLVVLPFTVGGAPGTDDLFGLYDVTVARLRQGAGLPP